MTRADRSAGSPLGGLLRLLAIGCAMGLGVVGWNVAQAVDQRTQVLVHELAEMALLLVIGTLSARAMPDVRWGAAVAGVVAVALSSAGAVALSDGVHLAWNVLAGSRGSVWAGVLVQLVTATVAGLVAFALLRASTGGVLLPGASSHGAGRVAARVAATGAASLLGTSVFSAANLLVEQLATAHQPTSFVAGEARVIAVNSVLSLLVLLAVSRAALLRRADAVQLVAAGVVAYPLFLLAAIPVAGVWPSASLVFLILVAVAVGVASTVWATGSSRGGHRAAPASRP